MILPYYQVKATSDERTNSLVVRAPENIQSQIQKILEVIDNPKNTKSLEIIKINHLQAQDLSIIIQNVISYKYKTNQGICLGDNKTNKILILEEPKNLLELKEIISKLDTKIIFNDTILIKKLKNANSTQLSNLINSIR